MINNVVLVSGVQQSDSVIHIHVSILFQILFPILQNIEQSSLCSTVGPCWLSICLSVSFLFCFFPLKHFKKNASCLLHLISTIFPWNSLLFV